MVGKVLTQNGVVEPIKTGKKITGYRLIDSDLSEKQRADLSAICDDKLNGYILSRGDAIWSHRSLSDGYVSGSVRYEVFKRAKYRCELCGAHETQVALHIEKTHITRALSPTWHFIIDGFGVGTRLHINE